ncbi:MAG: hypothetical protein KF706_04600 [Chitinophagales bacterium]|nr:hypothetical protein [Chitinophagales bacterium]
MQAAQAQAQTKACKRASTFPQTKIELKKKSPSTSEENKIRNPQTDTTKTVKLNNDNGLQTRWTRKPAANSSNRCTTTSLSKPVSKTPKKTALIEAI